MSTYDPALMIVTTIHAQLAGLARSMARALQDGKVSPWEGMALGMQGATFASALLAVQQSLDAETRAAVLYVLEHGVLTLPAAAEDTL